MTDQRHHAHKHSKVTTAQQDSGSLCTCAYRTQRSDCIRDGFDGGRGNALVRGEQHPGARRHSGKVPGRREDARQLQNDPHNWEHMRDERCFAGVGQHRFNGGQSPPSLNPISVKRRNTVSVHNNHNSISRDALLPYIARNLLLAKLAPFIGSFTNTQSEFEVGSKTKTMDMIVPHKKHRTRTEEDESARRHRHHRRHHRNGHKSDGELEKERTRAKIRGVEKERSIGAHMERSSSDRGKVKEKASASSPERTKRVETDEEREERRRRRRERKEAEAFAAALAKLETDPILSDGCKGHRSHRRGSERRSSRKENRYESDRDGNLSPRSDRDKQLILARKERESSKVSTRETLRPHVSSNSRRAESKQRVGGSEKNSEHTKSIEKEKGKESSNEKSKSPFFGFILERKDKMVQCVSCLSDDIPTHQAAKLACNHHFCGECLKRIFTLSLTDPALMPPKCCTTEHIPLKHVERLLSYKTKKQWNRKYSEYTSSNRVYCPTKDCGHWISPKHIEAKTGTCSRCKTRVCTMCNGKAHDQSECPQDEDTKVFIQTAKENGYQRCYECKAVVELKSGCNHITCRCTAEFCYRCGDKWKTCDCPWFAYPDSEEDEDEQEDQAAPAPIEEENAEARRERRRREQREREQAEQEERRNREAQVAQDEALARRLAQASFFLDKETLEKLNDSGSLRTGLRNSYKRLAEEYAEASKRDEEAREERVRDRLQKFRDRDEAVRSARRGSTSSHREPRSPTVRHERRHSEPRPLAPRGSHSRPQTAQPTPSSPLTRENPKDGSTHRGLFDDDERAARIAKYIMGELDELDDAPTVQLPSPVEKPAGSCSPRHRPYVERVRRATLSAVEPRTSSRKPAEYGRDGRPSHHQTSKAVAASVLPRTLPRLETPGYATSSVLADVAFPLENEKPSRRSSSHTRAGKIRDIYVNTTTKSAPTSPMHSTPTSALDSTSSRRSYLADLGYKFLKHQQAPAPHSAYPLNSAAAPAPVYTTYAYSSYSGFGAGTGESSRARQFTQNWGGIEAMGSTWKEPFADRLELATRVGIPRTSTY